MVVIACLPCVRAQSQSLAIRGKRGQIDQIVKQALANGKVPSASVAIVKNGHMAYVQAYGDASLEPRMPARPEMRYKIGSITKQFTATAILMLADEGKLTLDDPVSRFLPRLTRAGEVTIRQVLSHTAGYQDYWPQDYVPPFMLKHAGTEEILNRWARKPLDFDPGIAMQYSNTNYIVAGAIVEQASGQPFIQFLGSHIFIPLGMSTAGSVDQVPLLDTDPTGYMRYALGPLRIAPKEGPGWLFAAGGLEMSAEDLAKWDIAMLDQRLLKPSSYKEMQNEVRLRNGVGTQYGLGLGIYEEENRRMLEHGGGVSGFTSDNIVFPDDRVAVSVLTNQNPTNVASEIAHKIVHLLFADDNDVSQKQETNALHIFEDLQHGKINRALFTVDANSYFTPQALNDYATSLGSLGIPTEFALKEQAKRGGMVYRHYEVKFSRARVEVGIREIPGGKIEEYQIMAEQ